MTPYEQRLAAEQLLVMDQAIEDFLETYARHRGDRDNQRSVLFFPGGMGSELVRAHRAFDPALPTGSYRYRTVWVDLRKVLFDEAALLLQMNGSRDSNDRFIVASGPLQNCALHPYDEIAAWAKANALDLLTVGWDFRRNADWVTGFVLDHLVPEVQRRAAARGWEEDPLGSATLIGHSFGGMVVKWILNRHDHRFCRGLRLAVTVASPFYGSTGQTERLFRSEPMLGPFYDADEVTKVIATMPGGYSLFLLDGATYDRFKDALAADPEFPLDRYPSFDAADPAVRVDPYHFQACSPHDPNLGRFPIRGRRPGNDWTWFQSYLQSGLADYARVAEPLHDSLRDKLHCIRGVQTDGGADAAATKVMQQWGWYDYTRDRLPQALTVVKTFGGAGDGVIPAWSARLATQDADHVHTIRGDLGDDEPLEHMTMMDHDAVRARLLALIRPGHGQAVVARSRPAPASRAALQRLEPDISGVPQAVRLPAWDDIERLIGGIDLEQQASLALRWLIELHKGEPPTEAVCPPQPVGPAPRTPG